MMQSLAIAGLAGCCSGPAKLDDVPASVETGSLVFPAHAVKSRHKNVAPSILT
jgi:hypothetical protein